MRKQLVVDEHFNTLRYNKSQEFPFGSIPHFERWANPNAIQLQRQEDYKNYFTKKYKNARSDYRNKILGFYLCRNNIYNGCIMLRLCRDNVLPEQKAIGPYAKRSRRFYSPFIT